MDYSICFLKVAGSLPLGQDVPFLGVMQSIVFLMDALSRVSHSFSPQMDRKEDGTREQRPG